MAHIADDRRYMDHETRAIDDPRFRGRVKPEDEGTVTCSCGKTVYRWNGHKVSAACPRCDA